VPPSAKNTPKCTNIAVYVLRPADAVNRPAQTCWQLSAKPPYLTAKGPVETYLSGWSFGIMATTSHRSAIAGSWRKKQPPAGGRAGGGLVGGLEFALHY